LWDDIRDVKPKMIMAFVAALAQVQKGVKLDDMGDVYNTKTTAN